jgi:hypothetical protein
MNYPKQVDSFNEALRILWLENANKADINSSEKELNFILSTQSETDINKVKESLFIDKLYTKLNAPSLGQLILEALKSKSILDDNFIEQSKLPNEIITALKEDSIFPNNIPVRLLKNILNLLNISFEDAEQAIWKTYSIVKNKGSVYLLSSKIQPAFRHKNPDKKSAFHANSETDGRELFENEDAVKKYVNRLKELINQEL